MGRKMRILPAQRTPRILLLLALVLLLGAGSILLLAPPPFPGPVADGGGRLVREEKWRTGRHPHQSELNDRVMESHGCAAPSEDGRAVWLAAGDHLFRFGESPAVARLERPLRRRRFLVPRPAGDRLLIRSAESGTEVHRLADLEPLEGPEAAAYDTDPEGGRRRRLLHGRTDTIATTTCVFTPDGRRAAVGPLADGCFEVLETEGGRVLGRLEIRTGPEVDALANRPVPPWTGRDWVHLDAAGRLLAVEVIAERRVRVLDVETGAVRTDPGTLVAPGTAHAVFDHDERGIRVPGILERAVPAMSGPWLAVLVREDPSRLAGLLGKTRKRRTVLVIDLRTSEVVLAPVFFGRSQFGFSPSGNAFALFESRGNLRTWRLGRP